MGSQEPQWRASPRSFDSLQEGQVGVEGQFAEGGKQDSTVLTLLLCPSATASHPPGAGAEPTHGLPGCLGSPGARA